MDRSITEIFSELGRRLESFGTGDTNRAATNIAHDMLSPETLRTWMALYPALPVSEPRNALIIMAGNIPFVGIHDLICTLSAGHRAIVKPSSKDFSNMSWVVEQLLDIAPDLPVALVSDTFPTPDAVIAMGSNDTVAAIREKYAGIPTLLRGNRSSLAVLSGGETDSELAGLADDVLLYGGFGCRNVSLVFVPRGYDFSRLHEAFNQRKDILHIKHYNNYRQARAMLLMNGLPHLDCESCLLVGTRDFSSEPSILNYAFYDTLSEVTDWVTEHDAEIQCVARPANLVPDLHPRAVPFGTTQRPLLTDYPDGRDTMQFLSTI